MNMPQKAYQYLALGDSYTIGEMVSPHQRWPSQLVKRLKSNGTEISDPKIIAKTGWTTRDLLNVLDEVEWTGPFNLVTLLIGVNNQYQNLDLMDYQTEFALLLKRAIRLASNDPKDVIVLSIPDWSVTPFAFGRDQMKIRSQIDSFNEVNRSETQLSRAYYFDITTISRYASTDQTFLSEDKLHPSEKMYTEWVDLIFPTAYQILQNQQEKPHGNSLYN